MPLVQLPRRSPRYWANVLRNAVTLGFAGAIAATACADDGGWPQFRGPAANPAVENPALPTTWSAEQNVEWSQAIPGRGWSSPIVVGKKIYVTTAITEGASKSPQTGTDFSNEYVAELTKQGLSQEEIIKKVTERDIELPSEVTLSYRLICLDLDSGKELWQKEFFHGPPPGGRHRKNSFTSETPVTDGKHIYVYITGLGLFAYDLAGELVWKRELEAFPIYLDFGTGSSPVLCDNQLIIVNDNEKESFIASFDKQSGEPLWKTKRGIEDPERPLPAHSGWVTPFIWRNAQRTEIVAMGPGAVVSYDLQGNELWRMTGVTPAPAASSFAVGENLIINGGRGQPIYAVRPGATGDIKLAAEQDSSEFVVWARPRAGTYIPTPVAYDGALYVIADNGILTRIDLASGAESYKKRIKASGADFTTSPWAYGGHVFFASEQGDVYVVKAGAEFEVAHVNSVGELYMASPAIIDDRLLLRTENRLMSIRDQTKIN